VTGGGVPRRPQTARAREEAAEPETLDAAFVVIAGLRADIVRLRADIVRLRADLAAARHSLDARRAKCKKAAENLEHVERLLKSLETPSPSPEPSEPPSHEPVSHVSESSSDS
jgi:predicted  nucleic acid-binding Zn-ribbon protein